MLLLSVGCYCTTESELDASAGVAGVAEPLELKTPYIEGFFFDAFCPLFSSEVTIVFKLSFL